MRSYPENFYVHSTNTPQIGDVFTYDGSGQPCPNRLTQGLPWWRTSTYVEPEKEKKVLIFADWRINTYSSKKIQEIRQSLLNYLEDGFSLYVFDNQFLISLKQKEDIDILCNGHYPCNKTILSADEITTILEKSTTFTKNQMMIIGLPSELNTQDFSKVFDLYGDNTFKKTKIEAPKKLICSHYSHQDFKILNALKKHYPHLAIQFSLQSLSINSEYANTLLENKGSHYKDRNNKKVMIKNDLITVEELKISLDGQSSGIFTDDTFSQLLELMPNISSLILKDKVFFQSQSIFKFNQVTTLSLDMSQFDSVSFTQCIEQFPCLTHLVLKNIKTSCFHTFSWSQQLTSLHLYGPNDFIDITEAFMQQILQSNLEELVMSQCRFTGTFSKIPEMHSLRRLKIINNEQNKRIKINAEFLQKLLKNTNQLQHFELTKMKIIGDFLENIEMPSLLSLVITDCIFSFSNLTKINAKNLRTLDLYRIELENSNNDKDFSALSLKYLNLSNCRLTNTLEKIIQIAPVLEVMDLHYSNINFETCTKSAQEINIRINPHLAVNFSNHKFTKNLLAAILNNTKPKLLRLSTDLRKDDYHKMRVPSLKHLEFANKNIDVAILEDLLQGSVETLRLSNIENKNEYFSDSILFENIREIYIENFTTVPDLINQLFQRCIYLEKLTMQMVTITEKTIDSISTNHLKELELNNVTVSQNNLLRILNKKNITRKLTHLKLFRLWTPTENPDTEIQLETLSNILPCLKSFTYVNGEKCHPFEFHVFEILKNSNQIQKLSLTNLSNAYSLKIFTEIARYSFLNSLSIEGSIVDGALLEQLLLKKQLQELELNNITFENDFSFEKATFQIKTLVLKRFIQNFTQVHLTYLVDSSPYLQSIEIDNVHLAIHLKSDKFQKAICDLFNIKQTQQSALEKNSEDTKATSTTSSSLTHEREPTHNPANFLNRMPPDRNLKFKFTGENKTLNQGMFIEKLSQFLVLNNKNMAYIPQIHDGMCEVMSLLHSKKNTHEWMTFSNCISSWNGQYSTLFGNPILYNTLQELWEEYRAFYLTPRNYQRPYTFLANNLAHFLNNQVSQGIHTFRLHNAWHTISVKYFPVEKIWEVYDPNYEKGSKFFHNPLEEINRVLGSLIHVDGNFIHYKPWIDDNQFIASGGLLLLCKMDDYEAGKLCNLLPEPAQIFQEELKQGVLICNIDGIPAWYVALSHKNTKIRIFTKSLIVQLAYYYPDYAHILHQSIAHLTRSHAPQMPTIESIDKKEEVQNKVINNNLSNTISMDIEHPKKDMSMNIESPKQETIKDVLERNRPLVKFQNALKTWKKESPVFMTLDDYFLSLINNKSKNQLIEYPSSMAVQQFAILFEKYCIDNEYRIFYIHSPNELICSSTFIKQVGNTGELTKGPGGKLYDFLKSDKPSLLLVNFDAFNQDQISRKGLSLLEKNSLVDNIPRPQNVRVIGLVNPSKPSFQHTKKLYPLAGIGNISQFPFSESRLNIPFSVEERTADNQSYYPINLFNAPDWKERLLGRWIINQDTLTFEPGILLAALESGLPIEIQNGPWQNPDFVFFWLRAFKHQYIEINQQVIDISTLKIATSKGYDWQTYLKHVKFINSPACTDTAEILNPGKLDEFLRSYHCDNAISKMYPILGIVENNKNGSLVVNHTRTMGEDLWARLLNECVTHNVVLNCHYLTEVTFPEVFGPMLVSEKTFTSDARVIQTTDIDATISKMNTHNNWKSFDVTELQPNHLLTHIDAKINDSKERVTLEFQKQVRMLIKALSENIHIILKGKFSLQLIDALVPVLTGKNAGQICIVTKDASQFNYMPIELHNVTSLEKSEILVKQFPDKTEIIEGIVEREPLSRAQTILSSDNDSWYGLESLPSIVNIQPFDPENSLAISEAFIQKRLDAVDAAFEKSPYAIIMGVSGVGKSTFVKKTLSKKYKMYYGKEEIVKMLTDKTDYGKTKVLFWDEITTYPDELTQFTTLFDSIPHLPVDGVDYPFENCKFLFGANPIMYPGRKIASLFKSYGRALVFEPMPAEFIYENILKQCFIGSGFEAHAYTISKEILRAYQFLCECSRDEIIVSTRELEMMAVLILSHLSQHPNENPDLVTHHYIYKITEHLVPKDFYPLFQEQFSDPFPVIKAREIPGFVMPLSRNTLCNYLDDLLILREHRRSTVNTANDSLLHGGLGGLICEYESEWDKDRVIEQLISRGYSSLTIESKHIPDKAFYRISIGLGVEERTALLKRACWQEGSIVFIDDIDAIPGMEDILNDMLMHIKPDGSRPDKPGFMIIALKKPDTHDMEGRYELSTAFKRRMLTISLPPLTHSELVLILRELDIKKQTAIDMARIYEDLVMQGKAMQQFPLPTITDLINEAEKWVKTHGIKGNYSQTKNHNDLFSSKATSLKRDTDNIIEEIENIEPNKRVKFL